MHVAIEIEVLTKTFGHGPDAITSVDGLSLHVDKGEIFGFLGPNGAGKTTTMKMLAGIIFPTSGTARLLGKPVGDVATRARIGFMPETVRLNTFMRADDFLAFNARLYGMDPGRSRQRAIEVLAQTGLAGRARSRVRDFSQGMMQRIVLAQAIINKPDLLFLDEPASALDPVGRRDLREIIMRLRNGGTTIFLNSHMLSEVELVCSRVGILNHGKLIRIDKLTSITRPVQVVDVRAEGLSEETAAAVRQLADKVEFGPDGRFTATLDSEEKIGRLAEIITLGGATLKEFSPRHLSLEAAFLKEIGEDKDG